MKVDFISSHQSFNGLWGQVKKVSPGPEYASIYEGNYYYPFKGESKDFLLRFKYEKVCTKEATGFGAFPYVIENIKERMLKAPLSFTEAEYTQYKRDFQEGKPLSENGKLIENELKQRGLMEYLNKNPMADIKPLKSKTKLGKFLRNIFK